MEITEENKPLSAKENHFGPDVIYAQGYSAVPRFCFDETVTGVFPDMIRRSVPGYGTVLELIPAVAFDLLEPGDCLYDLGCSLGAGLLAISQNLQHLTPKDRQKYFEQSPLSLIGIDNSAAMIHQAKQVLNKIQAQVQKPLYHFSLLEADILKVSLKPCKIVLMNYTLQFIPLACRQSLINKIFQALQPNGRLMISEKLVTTDKKTELFLETTHRQFKQTQGYSQLEIARKRQALENVLIRDDTQGLPQRLKEAGFKKIYPIAQCLQFHTFIAEK